MNAKEMLEGAVEKALRKSQTYWHTPRIGVYHASQVWGCLRKQYMGFTDPQEKDAISLGRMRVGSILHNFLQRIFNDQIISMEKEIHIPIARGVEIVGKYDMLCKDDAGEYVVDIKSTARLSDTKNGASPHHAKQLNVYMHALGVDRGFILEVEKTTLRTRAYEVVYDPTLFEKTAKRIILLDEHLRNNTTPSGERMADWECKYCDNAEGCEYKQV